MSGVSAGTVDRVLHNRGRVSEDAFQKVIEVLNQIDYKPNLIARTLGSKRNYRIAVLIPTAEQDPYWALCQKGIEEAQEEWSQYGIIVEPFFFDLYQKENFSSIAQAAYDTTPDGVLVAPIFYQEALPFFELYSQQEIPFVLFNTNIPEVQPLSFIGQDLHQSGRVGAELLHIGHHGPATFAVLHINEALHNSIHLLEKERGLRDYFTERGLDNFAIKTFDLSNHNEEAIEQQLKTVMEDPSLKGIFASTSTGTYVVASILEKYGKRDIRLIGYDLLDKNLQFMQAGTIDFLINQNPRRQASVGIGHLANHLLFRKQPSSLSLFPLEVITQQNLKSYISADVA